MGRWGGIRTLGEELSQSPPNVRNSYCSAQHIRILLPSGNSQKYSFLPAETILLTDAPHLANSDQD